MNLHGELIAILELNLGGVVCAGEGDGFDDFNKYQRPARDGVGYIATCPGESLNDVYIDDVFVVKALKRKYYAWRAANPDVKQISDDMLKGINC